MSMTLIYSIEQSEIDLPKLLDGLDWRKMQDLLPAVVQDAETAQVLMLGYMNRDALSESISKGHATFFSRSKQRLWTKGETSGNTLEVQAIYTDCDTDALLVSAKPNGPTCHLQRVSCFNDQVQPKLGFLAGLDRLVQERKEQQPEGSYTTSLFQAGINRISQKVGEEGVETALAGVVASDEELLGESADLIYHLLVLLAERGLGLQQVIDVLQARHAR